MKRYQTKLASKLIVGITLLTISSSLVTAVFAIRIFYKSYRDDKVSTLLSYAYELEGQYEQGYTQNTVEIYDHLLNARVWILRTGATPLISHQENLIASSTCHNKAQDTSHEKCVLKGYDLNFIDQVLQGEEVISYANKAFYSGDTLSIGIPIQSAGQVVGAILLHAPIEAVNGPILKAFRSLVVGALISAVLIFVICRIYAICFTSSIRQIQGTALELTRGNYRVHSDLKRADEVGDLSNALNDLASKLEVAKVESEKLEQVRQDFVANVSHEFRTPLTVIKGNAESLLDGATTNAHESYQNILNETLILEHLVTDLLDLSRLQQDQIKLYIEPLYLPEVISDALRSIRQLAHAKGLTLTNSIEPLDFPVHTDYMRLRQILIILLSNALNYTPAGGSIDLTLFTQPVSSTDTHKPCPVILKISDTGIGISSDALPFIWDRFYKVNAARDTSKSSGLGLAIAKNLLRLLKINVDVESGLNEGTTFTLTLLPDFHTDSST
ncbi:MAG: HAMP domain-containing sensor histidine kinase [Niameybacter sp.]